MLFALAALAWGRPIPIYESYHIDGITVRAKNDHEVYLLVLFKRPSNPALTLAAFTRLIGLIPLPISPFIGIVVDPSIPGNQLFYADKSGRQCRIRFPYRHVLREYIDSISKGVNYELDLRLYAILATVRNAPHSQIAPDQQQDRRKAIEHWRNVYDRTDVHKNITGAINELVNLKNKERAGLIKQAIAIQRAIDEALPPLKERAALPAFSDVDPTKGEYDMEIEGLDNDYKGPRIDEEAAENDDVVGTADDSRDHGKDDDDDNDKKRGPIGRVIDALAKGWRRIVGGEGWEEQDKEAAEDAKENGVKKASGVAEVENRELPEITRRTRPPVRHQDELEAAAHLY
jgi:hypothetical protein